MDLGSRSDSTAILVKDRVPLTMPSVVTRRSPAGRDIVSRARHSAEPPPPEPAVPDQSVCARARLERACAFGRIGGRRRSGIGGEMSRSVGNGDGCHALRHGIARLWSQRGESAADRLVARMCVCAERGGGRDSNMLNQAGSVDRSPNVGKHLLAPLEPTNLQT